MEKAAGVAEPVPIVRVREVAKSFGYVHALQGASLDIYAGEVLALIGDNGAGKSTMSKVLAGVIDPDRGEVLVDRVPMILGSVASARRHGIEIVYQDLAQAPDLSVTQNFFLGRELVRPRLMGAIGRIDEKLMRQRTTEALTRLGAQVPSLTAPVSTLSGGQRQAVAVARAVMWAKTAILMDEPTAALGAKQTSMVYDAVRAAADNGLAVVLVSHDIPKMLEFADRVAIMRHGRVINQTHTAGLELVDVLKAMLSAEEEAA